jgi:ABC-type transporter Mla subunit MlaD
MMEEIAKQGLGNLLTQGVLGVLLVLSWAMFIPILKFMRNELEKSHARCNALTDQYTKDLAELQKARLSDLREVLEALNRASVSIDELKRQVEARAQAILDLAAGFAKFVSDANSRSERWTDFRRTLEDVLGRLNTYLLRQPGGPQ